MPQENIPVKVGILELLRGSTGAQFVIPAYQRNYTWTAKKEVKQLLEDLFAVLSGERNKHFVGIMIYLEKSITPFQWERSVIDGQQRLTTIFLTLYAIKELMIEQGDGVAANNLENWYLINPFNETNRYKLKPLVSDDEVYQHIVTRDFTNIPDKNSNVYKNFIHIKSELKSLTATYTLNEILEAINKLYIVCVPIGDDDYPQKIFESINATGAKLTASDLIRNFLLMPIISEQQDEYYAKYWKRIETLVDYDAKKLEAFFRYFVIAKRKNMINKNAVYQSFTKWYDDVKEELEIEDIFIEIVNYAKFYNHLYKAPLEELEAALRKPVEEFRLNESDMPAPMLMELYAIYIQKDENGANLITAEQLGEIITVLNSYLMRRSLCGMDTSDISNYFPELLRNVLNFCNSEYSTIVNTFKRFLVDANRSNAREMPDDRRLVERIKYANMYRLRLWVNIFFRKLEMENNPAPVDFSALSIEHLMPQAATALWLAQLDCDKDTYDENLNRLGNLTLAAKPDNSRMSNHVWEYKNKVLASTNHLKINAQLLLHDKWKIEDIDKRTDELIKEIARLYPYYASKRESIVKEEIKVPIFIKDEEVAASAFYYPESGNVEVLAGSNVRINITKGSNIDIIRSVREEWMRKHVLSLNGMNLEFKENFVLNSQDESKQDALSLLAIIILCKFNFESKNAWCTNDGQSIISWIEEYNSGNTSITREKDYPQNVTIKEETSEKAVTNGNDTLLQTKKADWAFFTSGITLSKDCCEIIQSKREWRMKLNEKRPIKIFINGEEFDAALYRYNYDGRPNDVMQIRYSGKDSLLTRRIREICAEKYKDLEQKRINERACIEYRESTMDRYVHIYATDIPNVFRFKF